MGEDVAVVVFVPALVELEIEPERRGAGFRGVVLASQRSRDDAVGRDVAAAKPRNECGDLLVPAFRQNVVVGRAKRRLRMTNQPDAGNCNRLWEIGRAERPWAFTLGHLRSPVTSISSVIPGRSSRVSKIARRNSGVSRLPTVS